MKIPSARQAFDLATQGSETRNAALRAEVENAINDAIAREKFSVTGDGTLPESIMTELRKRGYTVNLTNFRNEPAWEVNWTHPQPLS